MLAAGYLYILRNRAVPITLNLPIPITDYFRPNLPIPITNSDYFFSYKLTKIGPAAILVLFTYHACHDTAQVLLS